MSDADASNILSHSATTAQLQWWRGNPLAVGHLVNHPLAGTKPNLLQAAFDFPHEWLGAAPIPTQLFTTPSSGISQLGADGDGGERSYAQLRQQRRDDEQAAGGAAIPGLALLTLEPIEDGAELFLNYRFNPDQPDLPDWYTDPFPEESARRWTSQPIGR